MDGEILDLSLQSLTDFPVNALYPECKVIRCGFNKLQDLPIDIVACQQLLELDARLNELSFFPLSILELRHLKILDLRTFALLHFLRPHCVNRRKSH